jgi:hypothetical protein
MFKTLLCTRCEKEVVLTGFFLGAFEVVLQWSCKRCDRSGINHFAYHLTVQ